MMGVKEEGGRGAGEVEVPTRKLARLASRVWIPLATKITMLIVPF